MGLHNLWLWKYGKRTKTSKHIQSLGLEWDARCWDKASPLPMQQRCGVKRVASCRKIRGINEQKRVNQHKRRFNLINKRCWCMQQQQKNHPASKVIKNTGDSSCVCLPTGQSIQKSWLSVSSHCPNRFGLECLFLLLLQNSISATDFYRLSGKEFEADWSKNWFCRAESSQARLWSQVS